MEPRRSSMTYLVVLLLLGLFLLALGALTVNQAALIRDRLTAQVEARFAENTAAFDQVWQAGAGEDWDWYLLLAALPEGESYAWQVDAVSSLVFLEQNGKDQVELRLLGGHNMLLAELTEEDGTVLRLPMAFESENAADVAQLFRQVEFLNQNTEAKELRGFWAEDDLTGEGAGGTPFYLVSLSVGRYARWIEYQSKPAGEVTLVSYNVPEAYRNANARFTVLEKAATGRSGGDYAARWQRADDLFYQITNEYILRTWNEEGLTWRPKDSLFSVLIVNSVSRPMEEGFRRMVNYGYGVRFSPMALALRELLKNGTLPLLVLCFLLAMVLLLWFSDRLRKAELRRYQDEITRQQQALNYAQGAEQSRRAMTSAIAHELKTPIAVLSSYAEAMQENIDADKQAHYLSVIREETGRMDRMVLELLDLSRLEAGKYRLQREDFDLEQAVKEVIEPLLPQIEKKQLVLSWQVEDPIVNGDPYRVRQIVENFMTNAIRHTPEGGKIVIRIGTGRETFSVENQGKSIPAENLKRVWETFWQGDASRNERGSGLGLAICRSIVELHGGSCSAENTAGGVRFSVSLERERQLFQLGKLPVEEVLTLDYPIAASYTTPERVLTRLGLVQGKLLKQELREGSVRSGGGVIHDPKTKLYPGSELLWRDYRITIRLQDDEKRRILLMERMRTGGLGNPDRAKAMGYVISR